MCFVLVCGYWFYAIVLFDFCIGVDILLAFVSVGFGLVGIACYRCCLGFAGCYCCFAVNAG